MSNPGDGSRTEVLVTSRTAGPWGQFHLATLLFQRVQQLHAGARPRIDRRGHKNGRIALLEVTAGVIPWQVFEE